MRTNFKLVAVSLFMLLFLFPDVKAQDRYEAIDVQEWDSGFVMLASGDSVFGAITYHCKNDVIEVIKPDESISTFSPVNVEYFVAINEQSGLKQTFRTLYWDQGKSNSGFKKPTFFEQLNEGPLTLIMRETYIQKNSGLFGSSSHYGRRYDERTSEQGYFIDEVRPLYYVLLPDGEIKTLKHIRKDLLRLVGNRSKQVKQYVKKNKLDYEQPNELTAIINYYNSLQIGS